MLSRRRVAAVVAVLNAWAISCSAPADAAPVELNLRSRAGIDWRCHRHDWSVSHSHSIVDAIETASHRDTDPLHSYHPKYPVNISS